MAIYDLNTLGDLLALLWQIVSQVLRLDAAIYEVILALPEGWKAALVVLVASGLSYTFGQSIVFFANRVTRSNFYFSLLISALTLAVTVFIWAFTIWFLAGALFSGTQSYVAVLTVVGISFAPYLFGFLILIPYLGNIIFYILRIWVLLAIVVGVSAAFQFPFWQALACSALGWAILELLSRVPFLGVSRIDNWLWRVSTGTERKLQTSEIVDQYVAREKDSTSGEDE